MVGTDVRAYGEGQHLMPWPLSLLGHKNGLSKP